MAELQWRDEFRIGIDEIDDDHKQLVALIGKVQRALHTGANQHQVGAFLSEIYNQIATHFALEERLMLESQYPAYADHKEDHETLLDDLRDMMDEVEDDGVLDEVQLTDDLDRWFSDHFHSHDAKLHRSNEV